MDTRYAIYFVPAPDSDLYRFGASVLGVDSYTGGAVGFPSEAGANWADAVREPRTYGFHATLKAPFRLASGTSECALVAALDEFVRQRACVDAGALTVAELGSFIALIPAVACPALDDLAAACVRWFEPFRAPITHEERLRRLRTPLTPRQTQQMDSWGYPFVFDDFRFHMTLTGPMPDADRAPALCWLRRAFSDRASAQRLVLDRLIIARQDGGTFWIAHTTKLMPSSIQPSDTPAL